MSFLSRFLGWNKPYWERTFTPQDLDTFYSDVEESLSNRGINFSLHNGYAISKDSLWKIDLRNLAQECQAREKEQWASIINTHFQFTEKVRDSILNQNISDFTDIAKNLVVRLWPEGTLKNVGTKNLVYHKDLYGTISTLALDLPDSIMAVTPQMASGWQKDLNELFRLGYLNVANLCQPNIIETVFGDKVRSLMISKDDNYLTATHILLLENHPECIGIFGSLVSAPVRDLVICHPIDEKQDISQDANMLAYVTQDTYKNSSGPVSPYLYWYYKQKYEIINYKKQGVTIPKRLNNFMHSL